ncbi:hypothetical protein LTR08_002120 [Meristemomyces frigidus]|nr:hypothetical protein LTR08_002120 [Meristemomyces frigidus]
MAACQSSPLLRLSAELRNQIYDDVASSAKAVTVLSHGDVLTAPSPLSQVCGQLRREFMPLFNATHLAYATQITIQITNFCVWELLQCLQRIPPAAPGVQRITAFKIQLSNSLTGLDVQSFTKQLSELATPPIIAATMEYMVVFDPERLDLNRQRLTFARLAKQYRFHCSDGEQRVWEKIYWSFAVAAEQVDGIGTREYAMGYWKSKDGGMRFV